MPSGTFGGLVADALGHLHQSVPGNQPLLGVGAGWHARIGHPVTDRDLGHAVANRLDDAATLHAEHMRQLGQRVETGAVVDIDEVQADRGVTQAYLALARSTNLDLLPEHLLGPAGLVDTDRVSHLILLTMVYVTTRRACRDGRLYIAEHWPGRPGPASIRERFRTCRSTGR
jgi:hypothetical protein